MLVSLRKLIATNLFENVSGIVADRVEFVEPPKKILIRIPSSGATYG